MPVPFERGGGWPGFVLWPAGGGLSAVGAGARNSALAAAAGCFVEASTFRWEVEESLALDWASDLREGSPCFLRIRGGTLSLLQIPTTGPCIEELLTQGIREEDKILKHLISSQMKRSCPVMAVHAEVEGGHYAKLFNRLVSTLLSARHEIITLGDMAKSLLSDRQNIPAREFTMISLPGRAGMVASSK